MKLSVSLSAEDVAALDRCVAERGLASRSEGVRHAIRLLRAPELIAEYAAVFQEWEDSGEEAVWAHSASDGLKA